MNQSNLKEIVENYENFQKIQDNISQVLTENNISYITFKG
ncbi:hypothetical protein ADO04_00287 [Streptococcus parauberis]|nr:hypothetical protein TN39_01175 [Streptococcus parauberis]KYP19965.1 hypothetical protein AKL14_00769 [Streptococcus parauberis]KYP22716.1 hypothetical protein AKL13_00039 [Streptococcus parauberis]KYP24126.1 hypothetical protein TP84_01857 [Streptococcus parauberis]KYP25226.1 hypothetical protein TM50_01443 [Streptococcus parauberis]